MEIKPWTIKGIAPEDRNAAIAAAERERMTIGEWLSRAIRSQVQADRQQDRAPAVVRPELSPSPPRDFSEIIDRLADVAVKAAHPELDQAVRRSLTSALRHQLRELRREQRATPSPG